MISAEGFQIETTTEEAFGSDPRTFCVDQEENDTPYYKTHFFGKDHINIIVGMDENTGPIVISAIKFDENSESNLYKVIVRTKKGSQRRLIEMNKKKTSYKDVVSAVDADLPLICKAMRQIKDSKVSKDLEFYESRQVNFLIIFIFLFLSHLLTLYSAHKKL